MALGGWVGGGVRSSVWRRRNSRALLKERQGKVSYFISHYKVTQSVQGQASHSQPTSLQGALHDRFPWPLWPYLVILLCSSHILLSVPQTHLARSASGHLHWLFPLLGMFFPQISIYWSSHFLQAFTQKSSFQWDVLWSPYLKPYYITLPSSHHNLVIITDWHTTHPLYLFYWLFLVDCIKAAFRISGI